LDIPGRILVAVEHQPAGGTDVGADGKTLLDPSEEGCKGTIQPGEHILEHLRVDIVVLGPHRFDLGELGTLMGTGDTCAAHSPGIAAFLQSGIEEFTAATQHKRHGLLLLWSWVEFVFESFVR
jgi:hypothetical protein